MVEEEIKVGDRVTFTGHGYRRAIAYGYAKLFGEKEHKVLEVRSPAVTDSLYWTMWTECIPINFLQRYPRYPLYPKSVGDAYNG